MSTILEQALKLPIPDRRKLADRLYDSIAADPNALGLSNEQRSEIERRLLDLRQTPERSLPWDDVRERLRKLV
ncbi:MAG: addiction module protein [Acidobacteria bacterium]|nr:addiction module protein [Acidobacteriota bacterium]